MTIRNKIILTTLVFAVPAFFLGKVIWPVNPMSPEPTSTQLPLLMILALLEALAFGVGLSFLIYGYPYVKKVTGKNKNLTFLTYLAIGWILINWWPHDNWHASNGMNLAGLITIEYLFHVSLMASGIILAFAFLRLFPKN